MIDEDGPITDEEITLPPGNYVFVEPGKEASPELMGHIEELLKLLDQYRELKKQEWWRQG